MERDTPLELETPERPQELPRPDKRPLIPEPLPVRLIAVDDVRLPAPAGVEVELDRFYVALLKFERLAGTDEEIIYRAENFQLHFDIAEAPVIHQSLRPLGVEIPSLAELEQKLIDAEVVYTRMRGTTPGIESLLLRDPAGNWVEIAEFRLLS